jgi:hypothetical protein
VNSCRSKNKDDECHAVCRQVVSSFCEHFAIDALSPKLKKIQDWDNLIARLEQHGLATVTLNLIRSGNISINNDAQKTLVGLEIRDRYRWRQLQSALLDVHTAFRKSGIEFTCIKGSAIANMVYPEPHYRPMEDLDILISGAERKEAQRALADAGFMTTMPYTGHLRHHHHLPPMVRGANGSKVMVELHTQGLSRDHSLVITNDNLAGPRYQFEINGVEFNTLGHIDHLILLTRHTFSRRLEIRLLGIMDILRYCSRYFDEIDWRRIQKQHPFILNTLRCLYPVTGIPEQLKSVVPQITSIPSGIGEGMMPLTEIRSRRLGFWTKLKYLFLPSEWWTHIFYNVPPEKSLLTVRFFYHPMRLLRWLRLRL